jgi:hypothetical protein
MRGAWRRVRLSTCSDIVVSNFHMHTMFIHDLAVEGFANGIVFEDGDGVDINFDLHRGAPWGNTFTNIHIGAGTRGRQTGGVGTVRDRRLAGSAGQPVGRHADEFRFVAKASDLCRGVVLPHTAASERRLRRGAAMAGLCQAKVEYKSWLGCGRGLHWCVCARLGSI